MPKAPVDTAAFASAATGAVWLVGGWLVSWLSNPQPLSESSYALIIATTLAVSILAYGVLRLLRYPRPSRSLLNHFLRVAREGLPHDCRAHVMKLAGRSDEPSSLFQFIATFNMDEDLSKYKHRITQSTPGVGSAFANTDIVHISRNMFDKTLAAIDPWPQHIFCARIRSSRCVITIDTSATSLTDEQIVEIKSTIRTLSDILAHYEIDRVEELH